MRYVIALSILGFMYLVVAGGILDTGGPIWLAIVSAVVGFGHWWAAKDQYDYVRRESERAADSHLEV